MKRRHNNKPVEDITNPLKLDPRELAGVRGGFGGEDVGPDDSPRPRTWLHDPGISILEV